MKYSLLFAILFATPLLADHELNNRNITRGSGLYQTHCAACHGVNLQGQPNWQRQNDDGTLPAPPHDETGHTWHHDNLFLFSYTKIGGEQALTQMGVTGFTSAMPAFGGSLSDDEIWDILGFIQSTWPDQVRAIQATRNPAH